MRSLKCFRAAVAAYSCLGSTGTHTAAQLKHALGTVAAVSASRAQLTSNQLQWHPGSSIYKASLPNATAAAAAAAAPAAARAGFVTDAAGGSSSAAASAAAAYNEELQALQGAGLSRATAAAVHQAWISRRFERFDGDTSTLHRWPIWPHSSPDSALSQSRLLADIRHLLTAHQAAAAAAEAKAAVEAPMEPSAQGVQGAGQQGMLGWGDLDMQRILMQEPGLLLVPVDDLAWRFDTLLKGLLAQLDRDHALQYVYRHRHVRWLLSEPEAAVDKLQQRVNAYVEVLGVPPPAALLAASESSHMATLPPDAFRRKLQHFKERWGAETAHATLKDHPHLLASSLDSVDKNSEGLQQLLGCSEQQLHRLVRTSRVLSTGTKRISRNVAELAALLKPLGFSPEDVKRLVLKYPQLLVANPVTISSKLEALKELLGPSAHRLPYTVRQAPSLLGWNPDTLSTRLDGLQQLLNCSRDRVCNMLASCPTVVEVDLETVGSKLQQLTALLGLTLPGTQDMCSREPSVLLLRPELIDSKLTAWAEVLGTPKSTVAEALYSYPLLGLLDAQVVSAHMRALQALVQHSKLWSAACSPRRRSAASGAANAVLNRDAYWQFVKAALSAQKQELPELHRFDARAAVDELWRHNKPWRQQQQDSQQDSPQDSQEGSQLISMMPHAACKPPVFGHFVSTELPQHKATHPNASHDEALQAVQQQYKQLRQRGLAQQLIDLHQLEERQAAVQHSGKPVPWPLAYSRNPSGRLLLRLEFLLATGLQEQVSLHDAMIKNEVNWSIAHPGFSGWSQLRLQHLRQNPSEWDPVLVRKVLKREAQLGKGGWSAAAGSAPATAAAAVAAKPSRQYQKRRPVVSTGGSRDQAGADTAASEPPGDPAKDSRRLRR